MPKFNIFVIIKVTEKKLNINVLGNVKDYNIKLFSNMQDVPYISDNIQIPM